MSNTKSNKLVFMKQIKTAVELDLFKPELKKEAIVKLKPSIFVNCGDVVYDANKLPNDFTFDCAEKVAFNFIMVDHNESASYPTMEVVVNVVTNNEVRADLDIFVTNIAGKAWTYIGKANLTRDGKSVVKPAVENSADEPFAQKLFVYISNAIHCVNEIMKYECVLETDLSNTVAIRKMHIYDRDLYNNFILSTDTRPVPHKSELATENETTKQETIDNQYEKYTGPYNFIVGSLGFDNLSDATLIRYKYEGSNTTLLPEMLTELPFSNFILQCTSVDDVEDDAPITYLHCINNKINVMAKTNAFGVFVNLATIDLNEWAIGSSIFVSTKHINGTNEPEWEEEMCIHINEWINVYTEFMLKFTRLMPYSENVNNNSLEIHTANVVNNTSVYKIVILGGDKKKRSTSGHKGGTHASPREHLRIGHKRTCKSGKITYVKESTINEGHVGKVHKEYDTNNLI